MSEYHFPSQLCLKIKYVSPSKDGPCQLLKVEIFNILSQIEGENVFQTIIIYPLINGKRQYLASPSFVHYVMKLF